MGVNPSAGFSQMQQINQSVARITHSNKASHQQTTQHLQVVDAKTSQAAKEVVNAAMDVKDVATHAKGNTINVIA